MNITDDYMTPVGTRYKDDSSCLGHMMSTCRIWHRLPRCFPREHVQSMQHGADWASAPDAWSGPLTPQSASHLTFPAIRRQVFMSIYWLE